MSRWFAFIAAAVFSAGSALGTAEAQGTPTDEPPLIAGRLTLAEGDAQIWRVEEDSAGQWDAAVVNDVVTVGTGLYIGAEGRNEVRVGPNSYRLGPNSRGGFGQLDYTGSVFNVEYGTLNIRLAAPEHGETAAVTVADVRVDLVAPGRYRIDASDNGPLRLTVFEGHGTVRGAGNTFGVTASQAVVVNPGGGGFNFEQPINTGFDQWALSRDQHYAQVGAPQYVSPYMTGYEDLNAYGDWSTDATYGAVWYPRAVPAGWAPYRYGQWRWVRPWGWTWVDSAPWGYAPFHYGRWVMVGPRWCWVPGGYVRRPVWAPALVGFVGGVSVAVGVGPTVGWYPLAPWNRYEPHYRHNPTYVTVINQTVINNPPRGVPRTINQGPGATVVPGPRFREPIHRVALPVQPRPEQLRPAAPPPLNVAPAPRRQTPKFAEREGRPGAGTPAAPPARGLPPPAAQSPTPSPGQRVPPPTRVAPAPVAEPVPGRGVTPPPALPGSTPSTMTPPPRRAAPGAPPQATPPAPVVRPDERPAPRPKLPTDQVPLSQPQPVNPAEPPRVPPQAPPTVRQPAAPPARAVQPAPVRPVQPAPAPSAPAQPLPTPARAAPPGAAPGAQAPAAAAQPKPHGPPPQHEQSQRAHPEPRGKPVEPRDAPRQAEK